MFTFLFLGIQLGWWSACLAGLRPWLPSSEPRKLGVVTHTHVSATLGGKGRDPKFKIILDYHEPEVSLGHMRLFQVREKSI